MEISKLISGKWYNPTRYNKNYYYKYIGMAEGRTDVIIADYFQKKDGGNKQKNGSISNTDFWKDCREVEYSEIEQFIPVELREKHCEYLIHN